MIRTFADLIEQFRVSALEKIERGRDPMHGPLRGGQFEGLTHRLLGQSLLDDIDLRVVAGKIMGPNGELSDEIDCMLVGRS